MDKARAILPEQRQDLFDSAISKVTPGSPLREAIDMITSAQNGALICIGDVKGVLEIGNGGFRIDTPFTPQRLFELSKMDGAIVLSDEAERIVCANFHLNPDPNLVTQETGMRHRSAARTSAQTDAVVIAISKRRTQTTLYRKGQALTLDPDEINLSKSNQGILALQSLKNSLEKAALRQSFIELDNLVTVVDVAALLARYANLIRLAASTERYISFLGNNSGLLRNQLEEIIAGVADSFILAIRDYATTASEREARKIARSLLVMTRQELTTEAIMVVLGFTKPMADEDRLSPRGFRVISRISMLDEAATSRIVEEYGSLAELVNDSKEGFDRLDNAGIENARAIAKSFMQLRTTL
ncbi:MAG: DNA integrity scanning diadenylate cyclase DisA [Coriobacteriales bacterium]|jgi:diadenylate cyclase|nr:DNA integrity scanning diadenylate cyclase DisA [Coriobacteriales bacterium]